MAQLWGPLVLIATFLLLVAALRFAHKRLDRGSRG